MPLFLFLLLFVVYPVGELIRMAFSNLETMRGEFVWDFNGFSNLGTMVNDKTFLVSLRNTVVFVLLATTLQIIIGTALAVLVEKARFLGGLARNVLIWPAIITPVAISVIWWLIINIEFGVLNHILDALGLPEQRWLASTTWALPALIVVDVWHWTPLVLLLVLAGLANIDHTLYEAARMDGASEWKVLWGITLPLLAPVLVVAAITRIVLGFKVFDEIYVLTSGGPGLSTEVISIYIRRVFFEQLRMGYGAFLGLTVVTFLVVSLAVVPLFAEERRRGRWRNTA
ncbi:MAG: sugar ABC transporter permease [Chloroflexota bacterium]|nr:sugar ABC transporter permease [Chloroflexota bacterium]